MGSWVERFQMLSIQLVPFIMAVVFHEFAHGFVAHHWGDSTAKHQGRLTLNPVPHVDPIGTLLFPIINMLFGFNLLFGWARPVPIDPNQFRKYRLGLFWVSFAGPGMNFLLALVSALVCCAIQAWVSPEFYLFEPLLKMAYISVSLNYALGIFNLLPLPPLDGSKIVQSFLPFKAAERYETLARYSFGILMLLLLSGGLSILGYPIRIATQATFILAGSLFGLTHLGF